MVGIDLQRVPLHDSAQQIEAGVLIPSSAFIEVNEREKDYETKQNCGLAMKRRMRRRML
jgi:hypothetical protein